MPFRRYGWFVSLSFLLIAVSLTSCGPIGSDHEDRAVRNTPIDVPVKRGGDASKVEKHEKPRLTKLAEPKLLLTENKAKLEVVNKRIADLRKLPEAGLKKEVAKYATYRKFTATQSDLLWESIAELENPSRPILLVYLEAASHLRNATNLPGTGDELALNDSALELALTKGTLLEVYWAIEAAYGYFKLPVDKGGAGFDSELAQQAAALEGMTCLLFPEDWAIVQPLVKQMRSLAKLDDKSFAKELDRFVEGKKADHGLELTGAAATDFKKRILDLDRSQRPRELLLTFLYYDFATRPAEKFGLASDADFAFRLATEIMDLSKGDSKMSGWPTIEFQYVILLQKAYKRALTDLKLEGNDAWVNAKEATMRVIARALLGQRD